LRFKTHESKISHFCSGQPLKAQHSIPPTLQISNKYFEASNSTIPSTSLQRIWAALVKKAKQAQSEARVSSVRTGGGDGDAPLVDDATAQILAVAQAAVQLATPGKVFFPLACQQRTANTLVHPLI
jgi:hypothetical protein